MSTQISFNESSIPGLPPKMAALIQTHHRIGPWFASLYTQVMWADGHFSRPERLMIAAVSAATQDCPYLVQSHAESLRFEGEPGMAAAIMQLRPYETPQNSGRVRASCQIAAKLSGTPARTVPSDWQPLLDCGIDSLGLLEVAYVVGLSNYATRLADGFGLSRDEPLVELSRAQPPSRSRFDASKEDKSAGAVSDTISDVKADGVQPSSDGWPAEEVSVGSFLKVRVSGPPRDSPYNFGQRSDMGTLLGAHPGIGPAFWGLFSEIMFFPGALTRAEREMVAAVAAAAQDCHY
jgi:alkylhydroperoxidase family enzyme